MTAQHLMPAVTLQHVGTDHPVKTLATPQAHFFVKPEIGMNAARPLIPMQETRLTVLSKAHTFVTE